MAKNTSNTSKHLHSAPLFSRTLRRQKTKIIAITVIGICLATLALLKTPKAYHVNSTILFVGQTAGDTHLQKTKALSPHSVYEALRALKLVTPLPRTKGDFKALNIPAIDNMSDPLNALSESDKSLLKDTAGTLFASNKGAHLHLRYHNTNKDFAEKFLTALSQYLVNSAPAPQNSTLEKLEAEQNDLKRNLNALNFKYGPKHPEIQSAQMQIAALDEQITQMRAKTAIITAFPRATKTPNHPDFARVLPATAILSLALAFIIACLSESRRRTVLSGKQLEQITNVPCFALIPQAKPEKNKPLPTHILDRPAGQCAEAVKSLYLNIKLDDPIHATKTNKKNKIITVTSSIEGEGKTLLALWLAFAAAKSGEKTILVDADMREPSVHKYLGRRNPRSIVEYLADQNTTDEIIDEDTTGGIDVITARSVPGTAVDMITSPKMTALINDLRKTYDRVIIDSPAAMITADARALQKHSDLMLFAAKWNSTKDTVIHNAISQFQKIETPRIATVLTQIDLKKHTQYGYGKMTAENTI